MDGLPEEVLLNILHRLSVKSIGSCMCVNKNLHSIIKNPYFVSSYTNNIRNNVDDKDNQYLIFWTGDKQFELRHENDTFELYKQFNLPIDNIGYYHPVCNGMLCLLRGRDLILWNPTIQKSLTLPRSSSGLLAANVAFWFDSLTNDYKVIKIPFTYDLSPAEVFSLNNNQWKDVSQIAPKFSFGDASPPVFNIGTLNWIEYHYKSDRRKLAILSFDVNVEVFQTIELPDVVRRYSKIAKLLLYKETYIAVCCLIYDRFDGYINGPTHPEIWVMKEYGNAESWFNLWTYDESQFPEGGTSCWYSNPRAIGLLNNGDVLWEDMGSMNPEVHVPNESKMIISTDPETGEYHGLAVFPDNYFWHRNVVRYFVESLILLDKV